MKLIVPVIGLAMLAGCSSMTKEQILAKRFEYNTEQVEKTVDNIPEWYISVPSEEGKMFAVGTAKTPDLQLAIDIATLNAKTSLADSLNSRVRSQTKNFVSKLGSDDLDSSVITDVEKATRNIVVDVDVSGWTTKETDIQASGTQYVAYVMLEYSGAKASQIVYNRLSQDRELIKRIRSTDAFKELDANVNYYYEAEKARIEALR